MSVTHDQIRARFPALAQPTAFLDNAGGSQLPDSVIEAITQYLRSTYVQLGADYDLSRRAVATIERARALAETLVGSAGHGKVVFGPSTSALFATLGDCYRRAPHATRNEIVVAESGHEANVAPWLKLAAEGYRVRWWRFDRTRQACPLEELAPLLSERTRLVAVPHVSNLLGAIEDLPAITELAHRAGARVVVDGVAFAPHRPMDVAAWGVDWYVYSVYKVYGPHMAAMFGTHEALAELEGPNFFFVERDDLPYKMELGGVLHEGCAGVVGLWGYLCFLAGADPDAPFERGVVERAYDEMWSHEQPLQRRLIAYLLDRPSVTLIGPAATDDTRVPTISFVHRSRSSREIVLAANERGLGIRYGHFYAHRLASALGLEPDDGVVRTSLLHYNSLAEVDRLIALFEELL